MKEDMFEVLMYLFENHMQGDCKLHLTEEALLQELETVGFNAVTIDRALSWLDGLVMVQECTVPLSTLESFRIFTPYETYKLSSEIIGFLLSLEQKSILNPITRELVINRLLAIEEEELTLPQVKWIILLVLFNQPNQEAALASMENLILENTAHGLH